MIGIKKGLLAVALSVALVACATEQPAENTPSNGTGATNVAAPADVPPAIAALIGSTPSGGTSVLMPPEAAPAAGDAAAGNRYIYTTLRVVANSNSRGCGYGNWSCMDSLCKRDLGQTASRGWGGCWSSDNRYICYFECAQVKTAF